MTLFAWARFPRGIDQLSYDFLRNVTLPFRYYFHRRVSLPTGCAFQKVLVSLNLVQTNDYRPLWSLSILNVLIAAGRGGFTYQTITKYDPTK